MLPETYSGEGTWSEWIVHFENVATVNSWDDVAKLNWLKVRLTGRAQKAYQHLSATAMESYSAAKKALKERFEPTSRRVRYQAEFQARRRQRTEGWAAYAEDLKALVEKAFSELEEKAREQLVLNQYLGQLDIPQVAFVVRQTRPKNLEEAVSATLEMECYSSSAGTAKLGVTVVEEPDESGVAAVCREDTMTQLLQQLLRRMDKLETDLSRPKESPPLANAGRGEGSRRWTGYGRRAPLTCWNCGKLGHVRRECKSQITAPPQGN